MDILTKIKHKLPNLSDLTTEAVDKLADYEVEELGGCEKCNQTGWADGCVGDVCDCVVTQIEHMITDKVCADIDPNLKVEAERYRYENKRLNEQVRQMRKTITSLEEVYPF